MPGSPPRAARTRRDGRLLPTGARRLVPERRRPVRVHARASPLPSRERAVDIAGEYANDIRPEQQPHAREPHPRSRRCGGTRVRSRPDATPVDVAAGQTVTLEASWPAETHESFLVYDVASRELVTQHESLRLAWFATGGEFQFDATGRTDAETETFTRNVWTAPTDAGTGPLLDGAPRQPRRHRLRGSRNRRDAVRQPAFKGSSHASFRVVCPTVTGPSPPSSRVRRQ